MSFITLIAIITLVTVQIHQ